MFIPRKIEGRISALRNKYPIISLSGPRQSGKTTLLKNLFQDYQYLSLENPDHQDFAVNDPKQFLNTYSKYVILDEVQRVPKLFNYLQGKVDEDNINGQYILSGSQNYLLMEQITQSLAGRVALFKLFPFSFGELSAVSQLPASYEESIFKGFYPRIYDQDISPTDFYPNYFETYVQRDVRQLKAVQNLTLFRNFVRLCAGRIGQPLNYQNLAADTGISPVTAKEWMALLEASYIIFLLPPYFRNFSKRITKTPKLYFYDVGFAANLLGISSKDDVTLHFARGNLFENLIVAEIAKQQFQTGWSMDLFFWQAPNRREIDLLREQQQHITLAEIKSGTTINSSFFKNITYFKKQLPPSFKCTPYLIYGGTDSQQRTEANVVGWNTINGIF